MRERVVRITILFAIFLLCITGFFAMDNQEEDIIDKKGEQIVAVNELVQLAKAGRLEEMTEKSENLQESIRASSFQKNNTDILFFMCGICILNVCLVFCYTYFDILRPFDKMKQFARHIAQGNLDIPLTYTRANYFGEFTWAFDSMRCEIKKARACEREAIENNKTVIATLSHDIKTPIASIRAYAEGLEANLDNTPEKRARYVSVIMKKSDEVAKLTNDLFLHSLSDLDKLKINVEKTDLIPLLQNCVMELNTQQNDLQLETLLTKAVVEADENRFMQVLENIVNNARKYAKTDIQITMSEKEGFAEIHIRDFGPGIPDEDMPFIYTKFYRGKNCGQEQGSGLGLFIVQYIMEQMDGSIQLYNHLDGLEVILRFKMVS